MEPSTRPELAQLLAKVLYRMLARSNAAKILPPQNVQDSDTIALPHAPKDCSLSTTVNSNLSGENKE